MNCTEQTTTKIVNKEEVVNMISELLMDVNPSILLKEFAHMFGPEPEIRYIPRSEKFEIRGIFE